MQERVEEIARGLDGSNLDEPIHVWWSGKRWIVIEGHHRHAAYLYKQAKEGVKFDIPVTAHPDTPLEEALGMAGRLNSRDKVKISQAEKLNCAWRMVCMGEGSIRQQSIQSGATTSTISNMRKVKAQLLVRCFPISFMIDEGWEQSRNLANGKTQRDHGPDALEAMAHEMKEELKKLNITTILKSPDAFARALELLSSELPSRLLETNPFWDALDTTGRSLLTEIDTEEGLLKPDIINDF